MAQIKPLTDALQKIAMEELGEVPSRIPEDLQALKTWIEQQPHLRARCDDQLLVQFLRGCKYSLERAKEKIDLFFALKSKYPKLFGPTDVDEPEFREILNLGCYSLLPKPLNGNGPRIVISQFNYSADKHSIENIYYPTSALFELTLLEDPHAGVQGLVYIFDFAKATTSHIFQFSPNFCKKMISFQEKSLPLRIRAGYFINVPAIAQQFLRFFFSLLSDKLRQKFIILGQDVRELTQYIPLTYLPRDYGGDNGWCIDSIQYYHKTFDLYREYFKQNAQYGTDESLRPGNTFDLDGYFGIGGSFRKLAVD